MLCTKPNNWQIHLNTLKIFLLRYKLKLANKDSEQFVFVYRNYMNAICQLDPTQEYWFKAFVSRPPNKKMY